MDYARTIYNQDSKPITDYPQKLILYLFNQFNMKSHEKLLEVGCGRGDFLKAFSETGLKTFGVDISDYAKEFCDKSEIKIADLEKEQLPYGDNTFSYVYSKSFVEHFYYPEKIYKEIFRVLKPGGLVITLTPHWKYIYKSFYEDYSHRTPFTLESIKDVQEISGFKNVSAYNFRQLPVLWKYPFLILLSEITRFLMPDFTKKYFKWIRFSKEIMILSVSKKE